MTHDLIAFLRARLDDDEEIARAAQGETWVQREGEQASEVWMAAGGNVAIQRWPELRSPVAKMLAPGDAAHIAHNSPARVRREIEAKRRILENLTPDLDAGAGGVDNAEFGDEIVQWTKAFAIARLLAFPYAGHPDYHEEWRPWSG